MKSCMCSAWLSFSFGFVGSFLYVFVYGLSLCICMMCVTTTRVIDLCGMGRMDGCVDFDPVVFCWCVSSYSPTFQFSFAVVV